MSGLGVGMTSICSPGIASIAAHRGMRSVRIWSYILGIRSLEIESQILPTQLFFTTLLCFS